VHALDQRSKGVLVGLFIRSDIINTLPSPTRFGR
jgi:hypothetical protein